MPEQLGFPKPLVINEKLTGDGVLESLFFGTVFDQDHKPLAGANVVISLVRTTTDGTNIVESLQTASTNKEGKFSVNFRYQSKEDMQADTAAFAGLKDYFGSNI